MSLPSSESFRTISTIYPGTTTPHPPPTPIRFAGGTANPARFPHQTHHTHTRIFIRALLGAVTLGCVLPSKPGAVGRRYRGLSVSDAIVWVGTLSADSQRQTRSQGAGQYAAVDLALLAAGILAGLFQPFKYPDALGLFRFTSPYWLDIALVAISAF